MNCVDIVYVKGVFDELLNPLTRYCIYSPSQYGCDADIHSSKHCPVITVGGSYPGMLSALMRLRYPSLVQIVLISIISNRFIFVSKTDTLNYIS